MYARLCMLNFVCAAFVEGTERSDGMLVYPYPKITPSQQQVPLLPIVSSLSNQPTILMHDCPPYSQSYNNYQLLLELLLLLPENLVAVVVAVLGVWRQFTRPVGIAPRALVDMAPSNITNTCCKKRWVDQGEYFYYSQLQHVYIPL